MNLHIRTYERPMVSKATAVLIIGAMLFQALPLAAFSFTTQQVLLPSDTVPLNTQAIPPRAGLFHGLLNSLANLKDIRFLSHFEPKVFDPLPHALYFNPKTHGLFIEQLKTYAKQFGLVRAASYITLGIAAVVGIFFKHFIVAMGMGSLGVPVLILSSLAGVYYWRLFSTAEADVQALNMRAFALRAVTTGDVTVWDWNNAMDPFSFDPTHPTPDSLNDLTTLLGRATPQQRQAIARVYFEELRHARGEGEFEAKRGAQWDAVRWLPDPTQEALYDLITGRVKFWGRTGRTLNTLGVGGMWIGHLWIPRGREREDPLAGHRKTYLRYVYEKLKGPEGTVHIDAFNAKGTMPARLGEYWKVHPDAYADSFIATHWGKSDGEKLKEKRHVFSIQNLLQSMRENYLQMGAIHLLYVDDPKASDLRHQGLLWTLRFMRFVNYLGLHDLGVSISDPNELEQALNDRTLKSFDVLQTSYEVYSHNPHLIEQVRSLGIAIVLHSVTGHSNDRDSQMISERLRELAGHYTVTSILIGSLPHYEEHVGAIFPEGAPKIAMHPSPTYLQSPIGIAISLVLAILTMICPFLADTVPAFNTVAVVAAALFAQGTWYLIHCTVVIDSWKIGRAVMSRAQMWGVQAVCRVFSMIFGGYTICLLPSTIAHYLNYVLANLSLNTPSQAAYAAKDLDQGVTLVVLNIGIQLGCTCVVYLLESVRSRNRPPSKKGPPTSA